MNADEFEELFEIFQKRYEVDASLILLRKRDQTFSRLKQNIIDNMLRIIKMKYGEGQQNSTPDEMFVIRTHILACLCYRVFSKINDKFTRELGSSVPDSIKMDKTTFILFRNSIDILMKLGIGYRTQNTTHMHRPAKMSNLEIDNKQTRVKITSSLEYLGEGKFYIFYKYDKVSYHKTHLVTALSETENKYMAIYLYLTRSMDSPYVFCTSRGVLWESNTISSDIKKFVKKIADISMKKQHEFRNYFLNYIGVKYDYNLEHLSKAGILARNDIETIEKYYLNWVRYFHMSSENLKFYERDVIDCMFPNNNVTLDLLYKSAVKYCDSEYLDNQIYPINLSSINDLDIDNTPLLKKFETPPKFTDNCESDSTSDSTSDSEEEYSDCEDGHRRQFNDYIGIDASKNGVSVTIFKPTVGSDFTEGTFSIGYWSKKGLDVIPVDDRFTFNHSDIPNRENTFFQQVVEFIKIHATEKYVCYIERPLHGEKFDRKQRQFTIRLKEFINSECIRTNETKELLYIRNAWYRKGNINVKNFTKNEETIKYKNWQVYHELGFPDLFLFDSTTSKRNIIKQTSAHPISDIVDSIVICYWAFQRDIYRSKYNLSIDTKCSDDNVDIVNSNNENVLHQYPFNGINNDGVNNASVDSVFVALFAIENDYIRRMLLIPKYSDTTYKHSLRTELVKISKSIQDPKAKKISCAEFKRKYEHMFPTSIRNEPHKFIKKLLHVLNFRGVETCQTIEGLYHGKWTIIDNIIQNKPIISISAYVPNNLKSMTNHLKRTVIENGTADFDSIKRTFTIRDSDYLIILIPQNSKNIPIDSHVDIGTKNRMWLTSIILFGSGVYTTLIYHNDIWLHHNSKPSATLRRIGTFSSMKMFLQKFAPVLCFYTNS